MTKLLQSLKRKKSKLLQFFKEEKFLNYCKVLKRKNDEIKGLKEEKFLDYF